jgi:hypothetical protein
MKTLGRGMLGKLLIMTCQTYPKSSDRKSYLHLIPRLDILYEGSELETVKLFSMYPSLYNLVLVLVTLFSLSNSLRFYQNYDPVDLALKKNVNAACITAL